ncbi:unnamed protein product [Lymnaea stagnalis]|uniref:Ricin B lectin domain-containing protein n=1 Tax=Lymnaea stagnalis TaxID=6523 RepID=A0AAV2HF53_LYMST
MPRPPGTPYLGVWRMGVRLWFSRILKRCRSLSAAVFIVCLWLCLITVINLASSDGTANLALKDDSHSSARSRGPSRYPAMLDLSAGRRDLETLTGAEQGARSYLRNELKAQIRSAGKPPRDGQTDRAEESGIISGRRMQELKLEEMAELETLSRGYGGDLGDRDPARGNILIRDQIDTKAITVMEIKPDIERPDENLRDLLPNWTREPKRKVSVSSLSDIPGLEWTASRDDPGPGEAISSRAKNSLSKADSDDRKVRSDGALRQDLTAKYALHALEKSMSHHSPRSITEIHNRQSNFSDKGNGSSEEGRIDTSVNPERKYKAREIEASTYLYGSRANLSDNSNPYLTAPRANSESGKSAQNLKETWRKSDRASRVDMQMKVPTRGEKFPPPSTAIDHSVHPVTALMNRGAKYPTPSTALDHRPDKNNVWGRGDHTTIDANEQPRDGSNSAHRPNKPTRNRVEIGADLKRYTAPANNQLSVADSLKHARVDSSGLARNEAGAPSGLVGGNETIPSSGLVRGNETIPSPGPVRRNETIPSSGPFRRNEAIPSSGLVRGNETIPSSGPVRRNETIPSQSIAWRCNQSSLEYDGFELYSYNVTASNTLALNRTLPDTRPEGCPQQPSYLDPSLPKATVIICFHNEALSVLLRTVVSILDRSPSHLLEKVILVDDNSSTEDLGANLERELHGLSDLLVVARTSRREGLVRARLLGASMATSDVIVFLDAHCECNVGWLEPLLFSLKGSQNKVVSPYIDTIKAENFEFKKSPARLKGGFNWRMEFGWRAASVGDKSWQELDPIVTPVISGGLFAMWREYFTSIGGYDPQLNIWGGENFELSFKTWMCGGSLEIVPCSRVAHVFRVSLPYNFNGDREKVVMRNLARVAHVWMDDYADLFYAAVNLPEDLDFGDITDRVQLRKNLQCRSFKWYLNNIFPQMDAVQPYTDFYGQVRNQGSLMCLDVINSATFFYLGLSPCHGGKNQTFRVTSSNRLKQGEACIVPGINKQLQLSVCNNNVTWIHKNGLLQLANTDLCVTSVDNEMVHLLPCHLGRTTNLVISKNDFERTAEKMSNIADVMPEVNSFQHWTFDYSFNWKRRRRRD